GRCPLFEGQTNENFATALGAIVEPELMFSAVEASQSPAQVRQTHALFNHAVRTRPQSGASIPNDDCKAAVFAARDDIDSATGGLRCDAMSNRVFNNGLQHQIWNYGLQRAGINSPANIQTPAHPDLLDVQIWFNKGQLFLEGNFLFIDRL